MKGKLYSRLTILIVAILVFTSCDSKKIKSAQASLTEFQDAYKQENLSKVKELYPNITKLGGNFRKIDSIEFGEGKVTDNTVEINTVLKWTNPMGKEYSYNVVFYLEPQEVDGKTKYVIVDSRGFNSFEDSRLYEYALKKKPFLSGFKDVGKSTAVNSYIASFEVDKQSARDFINNNLAISGMNWESGYYSDYATGRAVVTNNTGMNIPRVKYKVTYFARDNSTILTTDDGVVDYSGLSAGESKSFSWYTSYINGASYARVDCYVDDEDFIEQGAVAMTSSN